MATLEKIRNKAGLLVAIIIGLALLLFVVGDMLNSGKSLFTNSQYEIAKIAGKSISLTDFQKRIENLVEITKIQSGRTDLDEELMTNIQNASWDNMIEEIVMSGEFDKLGLNVTGDELMDMIQGENPHPIIRQLFSDPQTGVLNRSVLYNFLQRVVQEEDSEQKTFWLYLEDEIYRQRKLAKFNTLVKQGLYVTSLQAERKARESGKAVDIDYIVQRFTSVPDSAIEVSDKDIKAYYKSNLYKYEQDESRDLKYVYFEVLPSEEDYKVAEDWINNIKPEFEQLDVKDIRQFINFQSSTPYNDRNYSYGELESGLNNFMFSAKEGDVYGPYFENETYKLAKLAKIEYLPDSVKARHILLQVTQQNYAQMQNLADSLKNLIEKGVDFGMLARTNSVDGSAQEGGDLGWFKEGQMVKPFSDSCFYAHVGDVKIVPTQYGLHIIEIMAQSKDVKKVKVGILERKVEPSDETDQYYYSKASEFAGINNTYEKFNKAIETENLVPRFAPGLTPLEKDIQGLESPRELVKWAYNADEHDVSDVMKFGNKYVVATIDKVREKGYAPLNDVHAQIEVEVQKEKKAGQMSSAIDKKRSGKKNLGELATDMSVNVESAAGIRFTSKNLPELGVEPAVVATAYALEENKLSQPVEGNNGIYVIEVTSINEPANPELIAEREKIMLSRSYASKANYEAYDALKKMANITDNRFKFY